MTGTLKTPPMHWNGCRPTSS